MAEVIVPPQPRGVGLADDELPSLHVATCISANLIAVVYDKKIIMCRLKQSDGSVETLATWPATQRLRSVAFLHHQASRKLLLLVAGDGKLVQVYEVLHAGASSHISLALVQVYGPHHKKISCVAAADNNIVLADKFGEVYQIHLEYDEGTQTFFVVKARGGVSLDGDDGSDSDDEGKPSGSGRNDAGGADSGAQQPPLCPVAPRSSATFLLQHFSLITQLTLTNAVPRRLITCDREAHVRVSKYPNTCIIEQFLWNPMPQSPVTSVVELHGTTCDGMVLATGDNRGRVTIWCDGVASSRRTSSGGVDPSHAASASSLGVSGIADDTSLHRVAVVDVSALYGDGAPTLGVVGLGYLHLERSDKHGLLVALDQATDMFYIPIRDGGFSVEVCTADITRVPLSRPALAIVRSSASSALVLQRGNAATSHCVATLESDGVSDSCRIQSHEVPDSALATEINALSIAQLDVFAHWRPTQAKDPRTRLGGDAAIDNATAESQKKKSRNDTA